MIIQAEDLGPVKDGLLVSCSTALARRLRAEPPAAVLTALGKHFQFEARPLMNPLTFPAAECTLSWSHSARGLRDVEWTSRS